MFSNGGWRYTMSPHATGNPIPSRPQLHAVLRSHHNIEEAGSGGGVP